MLRLCGWLEVYSSEKLGIFQGVLNKQRGWIGKCDEVGD